MSIMPQDPDSKLDPPDPEIVAAFHAGAAEALDFAWSAIHIKRYDADEPGFMGPDDFYHGIVKARIEVDKLCQWYRAQLDPVAD